MNKIDPIQLNDYWPYQVAVLADLISRHTIAVLKSHGDMNLSQWRVLAAVAEKPGSTAAEVVTVTPMDKGIVSRATASLVESGVIKKVSDAGDKRRSRLNLTKAGETIYRKIASDLISRTNDVKINSQLNEQLSRAIKGMASLEKPLI